jgi:hypothetical protein
LTDAVNAREVLERLRRIVTDLVVSVSCSQIFKQPLLSPIEAGTIASPPLDLSKGSYYSWPKREDVRRFQATGRRVW